MTEFRESVVLSDSHGYYHTMIKMFTAEGLTTPEGEWIADESVQLIHLGDTVDRGPDGAMVFNWLRDLQQKLGPERVVRLLGNHEMAYCGGPVFYGADEHEIMPLVPAMREDGKAGLLKFAHALKAGDKDWLCVHGGLDPLWQSISDDPEDAEKWANYVNAVGLDFFNKYYKSWRYKGDLTDEQRGEMAILEEECSIVQGISGYRGGYDSVSGVTWCDLVGELMPQEDKIAVNQIVGHRANDEVFFSEGGKLVGVNVYYGLAQLLRVDLGTGKMTTSAIHGTEEGNTWGR